jgi:hypothetical protein
MVLSCLALSYLVLSHLVLPCLALILRTHQPLFPHHLTKGLRRSSTLVRVGWGGLLVLLDTLLDSECRMTSLSCTVVSCVFVSCLFFTPVVVVESAHRQRRAASEMSPFAVSDDDAKKVEPSSLSLSLSLSPTLVLPHHPRLSRPTPYCPSPHPRLHPTPYSLLQCHEWEAVERLERERLTGGGDVDAVEQGGE